MPPKDSKTNNDDGFEHVDADDYEYENIEDPTRLSSATVHKPKSAMTFLTYWTTRVGLKKTGDNTWEVPGKGITIAWNDLQDQKKRDALSAQLAPYSK